MNTRTRTSLPTLACIATFALAAGPALVRAETDASADVEASRSHFDRGVDYVHDGDLKAALIEFKRAYAVSPNYRVLYNLGQVSNALSDYTEAQRYFQRYLTDGAGEIEPARKREVEALLEKLSGRIASLVLTSNMAGAELFVDDISVGKTPLTEPVRVSTGTREVTAVISGRPRLTRVIEAAGGETLAVRMEFPDEASEATRPAPEAASSGSAQSSGPSPALWLGIGSGVLAVSTGVMAYLAAQDAAEFHDALERPTTPSELDELDDSASAKALAADILLGATLVATTITVIVALQGSSSERQTKADRGDESGFARLSVGPGSVGVSGHFD